MYLPIRKDLEAAGKSENKGGTGIAAKFWEWTESRSSLIFEFELLRIEVRGSQLA